MSVSASSIESVPPDNLRVLRAHFAAVWATAEAAREDSPRDEFLAGIVGTCRWLAGQPTWSPIVRRMELPRSPALWRDVAAMPETIEVEYAAALATPSVRDVLFISGVAATLAWTWGGARRAPLEVPGYATG